MVENCRSILPLWASHAAYASLALLDAVTACQFIAGATRASMVLLCWPVLVSGFLVPYKSLPTTLQSALECGHTSKKANHTRVVTRLNWLRCTFLRISLRIQQSKNPPP